MPKAHGKRRKRRTHKEIESDDDDVYKAPKSFIIKRGKIGIYLHELLRNFRHLMYPNTPINLKEKKANSIKDFLGASGLFGVTHLIIFTMTEKGSYIKFLKNPSGPTITFKINNFVLAQDIGKLSGITLGKQFSNSSLLVMNGFSSTENTADQIMGLMLRSMFAPINIETINLSQCKRVVLFNKDKNSNLIEFRHYQIKTRQRDINKGIKKLVNRGIVNLNKYEDIADFILNDGGNSSDSEAEDLEASRLILPSDFCGRSKNSQIAIRLEEIGPRMTLELIKIQEGHLNGNVVFNKYVSKTKKEIKDQMESIKQKKRLKEERKRIQEQNVLKKKKNHFADDEQKISEIDEDARWYEEEVGVTPNLDELITKPLPKKKKYDHMEKKNKILSKSNKMTRFVKIKKKNKV